MILTSAPRQPLSGVSEQRGNLMHHVGYELAIRIGFHRLRGDNARCIKEEVVPKYVPQSKIGSPRLRSAEYRALTANLEVYLGKIESIRRPNHRLDPTRTVWRCGIRGKKASASMDTPANTAAKLVKFAES